MANDKEVYLPKQSVRRGKAGYKVGENTVVVDADGNTVPSKKSSRRKRG